MAKPDYKKPDYYARRAKEEGYGARSVFKLMEIADQEKLFRKGQRVLDLGASPGSWMKYASERLGPEGEVVGVDLNPLGRNLRGNERFIEADASELSPEAIKGEGKNFDLVLSDMMPLTSGAKDTDHYRSLALAKRALALALILLKPGGNFLVKVFQGPDFEAYRAGLREHFKTVKVKKPKSSRQSSREVYLLGLEKIKKGGE